MPVSPGFPTLAGMQTPPIILVPGFWLGAWAWDEVADLLRRDGHEVSALNLPGMESAEADRSAVTMSDHVEAIATAIRAAGRPVVLAVHSASGYAGYAVSDQMPEQIAAMVYVDTAPGKGAPDADQVGDKPMVWSEIDAGENLDGLTDEQKETFRQRAVPVPGGVLRESIKLTNDARRDIPSTVIATGYSSEDYKKYASEEPVMSFLAGIRELRDLTWIDLPTSHWPMWSKPKELAEIISTVAQGVASR
jgi:pimeloyl-ACP methyl ester carboxylesterase